MTVCQVCGTISVAYILKIQINIGDEGSAGENPMGGHLKLKQYSMICVLRLANKN